MENKELNFKGCETFTTDPYYDICNGYYDDEIKCEYTKEKVKEAVHILQMLESHLDDNELIG